jgi:predicted HTH transcriptional regulator
VTIKAIKLGAAHVPRKPTLYTLFIRLSLVTGIGSGVFRTIQWVQEATGQEPTIAQEANELVVALPRRLRLNAYRRCFSPLGILTKES